MKTFEVTFKGNKKFRFKSSRRLKVNSFDYPSELKNFIYSFGRPIDIIEVEEDIYSNIFFIDKETDLFFSVEEYSNVFKVSRHKLLLFIEEGNKPVTVCNNCLFFYYVSK